MATCKYCQYQDQEDFQICPRCGQDNMDFISVEPESEWLRLRIQTSGKDNTEVISVEPTEENIEEESLHNDFKYPWEDGGEEVVIDQLVPADAVGKSFETYFYEPGSGYGHFIFRESDIAFKFPKGEIGGSGLSNFDFDLDTDADGDFDADDLGCLAAWIAALGLGYYVKKTLDSNGNRETRWSFYLDKAAIQFIALEGRTIEFTSASSRPIITLRVAASDGERLYQELHRHFPATVSRWISELGERMEDPSVQTPGTDSL